MEENGFNNSYLLTFALLGVFLPRLNRVLKGLEQNTSDNIRIAYVNRKSSLARNFRRSFSILLTTCYFAEFKTISRVYHPNCEYIRPAAQGYDMTKVMGNVGPGDRDRAIRGSRAKRPKVHSTK